MDNSTNGIAVTLEGFYEASRASPNARLSLFVANGQSNKPERVLIRARHRAPTIASWPRTRSSATPVSK